MKKLSAGILILTFAVTIQSFSQERKLINYTEVGLLISQSTTLGDNAKFSGFRTRTGISKIVADHLALGVALGTDNYRKENGSNYNTFPFTLNVGYYLNPELRGLRADLYGGYAPKLFSNQSAGLIAGGGISYSVPVKPGMNLGLQTGLNLQRFDFPPSFVSERSFDAKTIRLGLGITFK